MDLNSPIEKNFRIIDKQKKALKKLGLETIRDLLFYFPSRYETFAGRKNISDLQDGDKTTIYGKVLEIKKEKSFKKKMFFTKAVVSDNTGTINVVWFRQPYIADSLKAEDKIILTGKISLTKSGLSMANPVYGIVGRQLGAPGAECIKRPGRQVGIPSLSPENELMAVYSEARGVTSRWLGLTIQKILKSISKNDLKDIIPETILEKYHLPPLYSALIFIHMPQELKDAEGARKRFAFEEIFFIQLSRLKDRVELDKQKTFDIKVTKKELNDFLKIFPFELTSAQKKSIDSVLEDLSSSPPMSRLLEGDVGSGKTAVAVAASYAVVKNGFQIAYMAPTEILAQQHFKSFIEYFSQFKYNPSMKSGQAKIGLITSSGCWKYPSKVSIGEPTKISRAQLLKWVENGEIPILIGTHSLIQKAVSFQDLALVIIDEQHRFGTKQRAKLVQKQSPQGNPLRKQIPHLLSMTATPIPRTLALTMYGDLDLSLLDEMPEGRKRVETVIVPDGQRARAYEQIRAEIKKGRQAYVICPRIDEPDETKKGALMVRAVKSEAKRLQEEVFSEFEIDFLHGKMPAKEKEEILEEFRNNKTQILVSTSVIEVGIDIPNSTMIVIEGAERFGLAQLHQLRGRVMRSSHQPYCFVFTSDKDKGTPQRLKALAEAKNGFELAEYDLKFRGAGSLAGIKQWGISDIAMEALKNIKMVEAARVESQRLLKEDSALKNYPLLLERLQNSSNNIHFE